MAESEPLTRERGLRAPAEELRALLPTAPPSYLEGAVRNPAMGEEEMRALLRNRGARAPLLLGIGRDRRWTRLYEVKKALAAHPATPLPLARSFVLHLHWRDLGEVADDPRVRPAVRRQAESVLTKRIGELALGERIALAHRASRALIGPLLETGEPMVQRALLENPRFGERDAAELASRGASGEILASLAAHPDWGTRRAVRLALVANRRTPIPSSLRIVTALSREDLRRLSRDPDAPRITRVAAARALERGGPPSGRSRLG